VEDGRGSDLQITVPLHQTWLERTAAHTKARVAAHTARGGQQQHQQQPPQQQPGHPYLLYTGLAQPLLSWHGREQQAGARSSLYSRPETTSNF
jgi:hypothetical protein